MTEDLQTAGGRSFRFFITEDTDHAESKIFWIISEGPDHEGEYPSKGSCSSHSWTADSEDTMGKAYDPFAKYNKDNLVMKLYSCEWEAVFEEKKKEKEEETKKILEVIKTAFIGDSPTGLNFGFTGDICRYPGLFRWEATTAPFGWDDQDDASNSYTKGQPRGLWTDKPNSSDDILHSKWGIGWRHRYIENPDGIEEENFIIDAWGREILFFHDTTNESILVLSRGEDGKFDFGTTNTEKTEPVNFTETDLYNSTYNPLLTENADNLHILIDKSDWSPGYFSLLKLTVLNATENETKCRFFRDEGDAADQTMPAETLTDEDGDTVADDWVKGDGTSTDPALIFNDTTADKVFTGARYLVIWNETDNNNIPDSGEKGVSMLYPETGVAGSGELENIEVDTVSFTNL